VFNPRFDDARLRGVQAEMERAYAIHRDVHVYQNPIYDPAAEVAAEHATDPGTMGMNLKSRYSLAYENVDEMLHAAFTS
jgi:hypothetical protein